MAMDNMVEALIYIPKYFPPCRDNDECLVFSNGPERREGEDVRSMGLKSFHICSSLSLEIPAG